MDLLDRLLDHDAWATRVVLDLCDRLSDEQLDHPFDIGHQSVRRTFVHMIHNIDVWTAAMTGHAEPRAPRHAGLSPAALAEWHQRSFADFAAHARRMRDENRFEETFTDFYGGPMTFGGAILHVILHNAEHRSEVLHILGRLGIADLPEIDHGLWDFKRRGL
jgi:uncharacterized damage-inducible protein DinB